MTDVRCVRSDLLPRECWHCRGLPDDPWDYEQLNTLDETQVTQ